ncbi:MAG: hypothetical protein ACJ762_06315 [Solirubrobacteraceae bacterium]
MNALIPHFTEFGEHEREQGWVILNLAGRWDEWILRRVEQVWLINDAAVRRQITIDFRQREKLFGEAPMLIGKHHQVHFVPLTQLDKGQFTNFDLRDEDGRAVPLLTRRKTASLRAAALVRLAQLGLLHTLLNDLRTPPADKRDMMAAFHTYPDPRAIRIPAAIEQELWRICYLPWLREPGGPEECARDLRRAFLATEPTQLTPVSEWDWHVEDEQWTSDVDESLWRWALASDTRFREALFDAARLRLVCAPIEYESERRRIIKMSYDEPATEPGLQLWRRFKRTPGWLGPRWRRAEDRLEGLRRDDAEDEWAQPHTSTNRRLRGLSILEMLSRGVGWSGKVATFELPAVGAGGTFHFEFSSPEGTQIRRARLKAVRRGTDRDWRVAQRYARNVQRTQLCLPGLRQGATGTALVAIKPRSSTIIRGACVGAALLASALLALVTTTPDLGNNTEAAVAILLLGPALLAGATTRSPEHTATTGIVYGIRLLGLLIALTSGIAAALLVAGRTPPASGWLWWTLTAIAIVLAIVLGIAWRLAGRGWPTIAQLEPEPHPDSEEHQ